MASLSEIRDSLNAIRPLEDKVSALDGRLRKAEAKAAALLEKYEKESLDVLQIQKETISSFVLKALGKYDERLEKEKREAIEAKLNYDAASADFDELKREKAELEHRLSELRRQAREYESELARRREYIRLRLSEPEGAEYGRLEGEIADIIAQITEIDEARRAADRVMKTAQSARDSLESAESWASFDMWTKGGLLSHAAKYSHIDEAEACFNRLSSQVRTLRTELSDVQGLAEAELTSVSPGQRAVDFWFDNIFTDISVRSQIRGNIDELSRLTDKVRKTETVLRGRLYELNRHLDELKRRQEDLLVSL